MECVRIECNQFTVVEGGSLEWREEDLYERTRPCTSSMGFWTGNVKTPKKGDKGGKGGEVLPQHTLTVEVAGPDGQRYDEDHNDEDHDDDDDDDD